MPKETKQRVVAFRISVNRGSKLDQYVTDAKIVNVRSANTYVRKLFLDWQDGKLVYPNPEDAKIDPALRG